MIYTVIYTSQNQCVLYSAVGRTVGFGSLAGKKITGLADVVKVVNGVEVIRREQVGGIEIESQPCRGIVILTFPGDRNVIK